MLLPTPKLIIEAYVRLVQLTPNCCMNASMSPVMDVRDHVPEKSVELDVKLSLMEAIALPKKPEPEPALLLASARM